MITDINSEDRLVQRTFAGYLRDELRWDSLDAWQEETFGLGDLEQARVLRSMELFAREVMPALA